MLIIELKIFDSGLTFLWFRTSIFRSVRSFDLLRLSFWFSRFRPFLNIRSASNFKLLSLTTRTAFYQILSSVFYQFKAFFAAPGINITIFKAVSGQFLLFLAILNSLKRFLGLREKFFETKCEWDLFYFESDNQNKDD